MTMHAQKKQIALFQIRLQKLVRKYYAGVFQYTYFAILSVCFFINVNFLTSMVTHVKPFQWTFNGLLLAGFAAIGLVNFVIAYAIVKVKDKQIKELKSLIMFDELTKVYNKRFFLNKLHTEIVRSRRYNHLLSVIVIDIDHFKNFNDTYGHVCGDVVLKNVARIIKREIRVVDLVCRFGGEEFVVICPETGIHEAKTIAERLRKSICETQFEYKEKKLNVTISAGVNQFDPLKPKSDITLFQGADQALYCAKNAGRNRVVLHSTVFASRPNSPKYATKTANSNTKKNTPKTRVASMLF